MEVLEIFSFVSRMMEVILTASPPLLVFLFLYE